MEKHTIAILGCGNMGEAIVGGLQDVDTSTLIATERLKPRREYLRNTYKIEVTNDNADACRRADVAILCVKPMAAQEVLADLVDVLEGKLLISICAGVSIDQLSSWAPGASIVRAMPNTPALIRDGMTVVSPGPGVTEEQIEFARSTFSAVGRCLVLEEKHLDAVTGLSASGPAFCCVLLESMADGGVMMGLPRKVAIELAAQSMHGAAQLVLTTGRHPAELKDQVTTPAGCTIAGLLTMEDGKIRSTLARTIQEATIIASGLGKK
ncbi:MAG: pyrroline-5-carboxylate reductase [Proteobacteria bacterium]|nr:pyrroline-5-carboxylate reductase [Pseudomonadota bacterium]